MTIGRSGPVTPLARPVDLSSSWNASDPDLGRRLHPLYALALDRLPQGESVFRGLPFSLGTRSAASRWILVGGGLMIDLRGQSRGDGGAAGRASHLLVERQPLAETLDLALRVATTSRCHLPPDRL